MKAKRVFSAVLSLVLAFVFVFGTVPLASADGMMQLIIAGETYNKIYTDNGVLALVGWTYDVSEDTLVLQNFGSAENPQSRIFAYPFSGTLNIRLEGNSYLRVERNIALNIIGNVNFIGTGSLTIISTDSYCVYTSYNCQVLESASLNLTGAGGIYAEKGFRFNTTGSVTIHADEKATYSFGDIRVESGILNLTGSNGLFTYDGNIFISGGASTSLTAEVTGVAVRSVNGYFEMSANKILKVGSVSPGISATVYNAEKYIKVTFSGKPKLNPPRELYWDDTQLPGDEQNPVARWSAVEYATSYTAKLYYQSTGELIAVQTDLTGTSCNFGGSFTMYGNYCFTVTAYADGVEWISGDESPKSTDLYPFYGNIVSRFYITLPESEYFTVVPHSGTTIAMYNESYSFDVVLDEAYTNSEILVWGNEARIVKRNGIYKIDHVTENITIRVAGIEKNTYTVSIPEHEAYTVHLLLDNYTEVEYGGSCSFSFELADIYSQSQLVVKANGVPIVPRYGIIYDVKNITGDVTVTVEGLIRQTYVVTYKQLDGRVISTDSTVQHGYAAAQPQNPTLASGLTFEGWYLDGLPYDFSTPVTENLTIYARYTAPVSEDGYYLISTPDQLRWFRDEVNYGNSTAKGRLTQNISFNTDKYVMVGSEPVFADNAEVWEPIGLYDYEGDIEGVEKFFSGSFDGNSKTISGICCEYDPMAATASQLGVFGIITAEAEVRSLNVSLSSFNGYSEIGSVVGRNGGTVSNCTSDIQCLGILKTGGIVGTNSGIVSDCSASGSVESEAYASENGTSAGGIAGINTGTVTNCVSACTVIAAKDAGGIVGTGNGDVSGCTASVAVSATQNSGGIVGSGMPTITNCINSASVNAASCAGGIIGCADIIVNYSTEVGHESEIVSKEYPAAVIHCSNSGNIIATDSAGGIGGSFSGTVNQCRSDGSINATTRAGGFVGIAESLTISNSHTYGEVTAQSGADAVAGYGSVSVNAVNTYYCSETVGRQSAYAADRSYDIFFNGYLAYTMNTLCGSPVWGQGSFNPVFADANHTAVTVLLSGEGTQASPYIVSNERELRLMSLLINGFAADYNGKEYVLTADISFHNPQKLNNFIPISSAEVPFSGKFHGGGHSISGLNISSQQSVGMFVSAQNAYIEDLTVANSTFIGMQAAGCVVGNLSGTIKSCNAVNCTVNGGTGVGGIAGIVIGTSERCTSSSTVVGSGNKVGGVVGSINGTLTYAENTGSVTGAANVGGVTGYANGTARYCSNSGRVNGDGIVGGVIGLNDAAAYSCANSGAVSARTAAGASTLGGVAGNSSVSVSRSSNSGAVSGNENVGGVVGENYGNISQSYSCGAISGNDNVGAIFGLPDYGTIRLCAYAFEPTSGSEPTVGGVSFTETERKNGIAAYYLNENGASPLWSQGAAEPSFALDDSSDAVVYMVRFYVDGVQYYEAAAIRGRGVEAPPAPVKDEYNFLMWDTPFVNVQADTNTFAVFDRSSWITLIPNSTFSIDETNRTLRGIPADGSVTVGDILPQIANADVIVTDFWGMELADTDTVFSGCKIVLTRNGMTYDEVVMVIMGDVYEDGIIDSTDAYYLELLVSGLLGTDEITLGAVYAADIDGDGYISATDATILESYLLKKTEIEQHI